MNTTHYRVTINHKSQTVILTKPLPEAPFFKNPRRYCDYEDTKIKALIHEQKNGYEAYFRNYKDSLRYFNFFKKFILQHYLFNNIFED